MDTIARSTTQIYTVPPAELPALPENDHFEDIEGDNFTTAILLLTADDFIAGLVQEALGILGTVEIYAKASEIKSLAYDFVIIDAELPEEERADVAERLELVDALGLPLLILTAEEINAEQTNSATSNEFYLSRWFAPSELYALAWRLQASQPARVVLGGSKMAKAIAAAAASAAAQKQAAAAMPATPPEIGPSSLPNGHQPSGQVIETKASQSALDPVMLSPETAALLSTVQPFDPNNLGEDPVFLDDPEPPLPPMPH